MIPNAHPRNQVIDIDRIDLSCCQMNSDAGKMGSRTDGSKSRRWLVKPIIALQAVALKRDNIVGHYQQPQVLQFDINSYWCNPFIYIIFNNNMWTHGDMMWTINYVLGPTGFVPNVHDQFWMFLDKCMNLSLDYVYGSMGCHPEPCKMNKYGKTRLLQKIPFFCLNVGITRLIPFNPKKIGIWITRYIYIYYIILYYILYDVIICYPFKTQF